jgi:hypothetical protein
MKTNFIRNAAEVITSLSIVGFLMFGMAYGETTGSVENSAPRERGDRPPDGPDFDGRHGRPPWGPPREAFTACKDKTVGITAQMTTPWGETIKGICREKDGKLFLVPDRPSRTDMAMPPCLPPPPRCGCIPRPMPPTCGGRVLLPPPFPWGLGEVLLPPSFPHGRGEEDRTLPMRGCPGDGRRLGEEE